MFAATAVGVHASTARQARAPALAQVDGGANYYARFSHGLPASPSYFPIGVWASSGQEQANINQDKASGFNLYAWPSDSGQSLASFAANGMKALLDSGWYSAPGIGTASANAGYFLDDEVDMRFSPSQGYTVMQQDNAQAPNDGRIRWANYSKGVLLWAVRCGSQSLRQRVPAGCLNGPLLVHRPLSVPDHDGPILAS